MYYVYYMFSYIYEERERDSWLIVEKTLYTYLKAVASGGEKWNHGGRGGGYTIVYNLTFVLSCNFASHKSDWSLNQTQVNLSFLKDATRPSCLKLRPQFSGVTLWRRHAAFPFMEIVLLKHSQWINLQMLRENVGSRYLWIRILKSNKSVDAINSDYSLEPATAGILGQVLRTRI